MSYRMFEEAIEALQKGKAVVFPTDTVYGIGVSVLHARSPQVVNDAKGREEDKPVAWLVEGVDALDEYGADVSDEVRRLAEENWPGALTIVVKASDAVPAAFKSSDGTVGLRVPANEAAQRLIRVVGPLAASSANPSGAEPPRSADELDESFLENVAAVVTQDQPGSGVASTVVDCTQDEFSIIREGAVVPVMPGDEPEESEPTEEIEPVEADEASKAGNETEDETEGEAEAREADAAGQPEDTATSLDGASASTVEPDDGIFTAHLEFTSHDLESITNAKVWTTEEFGEPGSWGPKQPKAVFQIVHGMAEHIDRYDDFARYLVKRGFVVCAEDHVGHGGTVDRESDYGHMPLHGGNEVAVGDVHTLHSMMARELPDVPYVLYGHSMGSFIVRAYIARYGDELTACVLSGTGNPPKGLSKAGRTLAHFIASINGERHRSKLIDNMGAGAYGKKIKDARTQLDWLSTDDAVVDAYIADPRCGFMFTVGGYATLLDLTAEVVTPECAAEVPKNLPVLFVAGDGDPVGDMGEGVKAAAQLLRDAGVTEVDEIIYKGMRHEIHNEIGHEKVYDDIATWVEEHV